MKNEYEKLHQTILMVNLDLTEATILKDIKGIEKYREKLDYLISKAINLIRTENHKRELKNLNRDYFDEIND